MVSYHPCEVAKAMRGDERRLCMALKALPDQPVVGLAQDLITLSS